MWRRTCREPASESSIPMFHLIFRDVESYDGTASNAEPAARKRIDESRESTKTEFVVEDLPELLNEIE